MVHIFLPIMKTASSQVCIVAGNICVTRSDHMLAWIARFSLLIFRKTQSYDIVHVRLLTAAMDSGDWDPAVRNLTHLSKPGGTLQWEEYKLSDMQYLRETFLQLASWHHTSAGLYGKDLLRLAYASSNPGGNEADLHRPCDRAIFPLGETPVAPASLQTGELDRLETQVDREIRSGCYFR